MNGRRGYPTPQGGGFYDPLRKGPAWGQGLSQLANQLMMMRQMQQQQEQQEWQRDLQKKQFGLQQTRANIELQEASRKRRGEELEGKLRLRHEEDIDTAVEKGVLTEKEGFLLKKTGKIPSERAPFKPTTYTLKKRDLDRALRAKTITQDQYNKSLFNLKQEMTPEEKRRQGASIRDSNAREMRDFYKGIPELIEKGRIKPNELRKMIKGQAGGIPTSPQGHRLDMPEKYNRAILNQRDGVATVEDENIIRNYEDMFKIFNEELKLYPTFKDWLSTSPTSKLTGLDKHQMKVWYDIYAEKGKFLGIL